MERVLPLASKNILDTPTEDLLYTSLRECIAAVGLIEEEQNQLKAEIDLEPNAVRRDYLWYLHDLVEVQTKRAAVVAQSRLDHLKTITTAHEIAEELHKCGEGLEGVLHWFRYYAWSLDPRFAILPVQPFFPFDFQIDAIEWIYNLMHVKRSDGVWEKSRTQGASWIACLYSTHHWHFKSYFQCLFGSITQDKVDSQKEPDTLLEKVRFQLYRTPEWMMPANFNFKTHAGYMKIANVETGALISGQAPTRDFGRAGRYSLIIFDEHASMPYGGYPQWVAASQSSRTKISVSTVKGKHTKQAELRFSGTMPVLTSHWKLNPFTDERWYNGQTLSMKGDEIAQELDIDYEASQTGRVFPMFDEVISVITKSEFKRVYGTDTIPNHWNLARIQDVGTTDQHLHVTAYAARPGERDPYNDTIFFYREFAPPVEWSVTQIAEGLRDKDDNVIGLGMMQVEKLYKEKDRFVISMISHEGESEKRTYERDCKRYPVHFSKIKKPSATAGLAQMRALMAPLPELNPFVVYPDNHPEAGTAVYGRSRFVLIVDDDEGKLNFDGRILHRAQALTNLGGHLEARREIPLYHIPATEKGKPVGTAKPFKADDDWIDPARYICRAWGPHAKEQSSTERLEQKIAKDFRVENAPQFEKGQKLTAKQEQQYAEFWLNRNVQVETVKREEAKKAKHWRDKRRR